MARQEPPAILVYGDSLSAGYGIALEHSWVQLMRNRLREEGYPHTVMNESVSGETSTGGLRRLPAALDRIQPSIVLLELGANDGLRGLPIPRLEENLRAMAILSQEHGAAPVIFEMRIPPNYGPQYTSGFQAVFARVASDLNAAFVPFFLADIALQPDAFQSDGIHPTAAAQPTLLDAVWPHIQDLLKRDADAD